MPNISNLQKLSSSRPNQNPELCSPFGLEINGRQYVAATNGFVVVVQEGETEDMSQISSPIKETISKYMDVPGVIRVDFRNLRLFAGQIVWPSDCSACKETGKIPCAACNGTGHSEHRCDHCDETHECVCKECEDGENSCPNCSFSYLLSKKVGRIILGEDASVTVNRQLLAMGLDCVEIKDGELVYLAVAQNSVLVIRSKRWSVFVCGVSRFDNSDIPFLKVA